MEILNKLIPTGNYKVTILSGENGTGKSNLLKLFSTQFDYKLYSETDITNGICIYNSILEFCTNNNKVAIDNIELYLDSDKQKTLLSEIFKINPDISIVCVTHSPMFVMNGWLDKVINIKDL